VAFALYSSSSWQGISMEDSISVALQQSIAALATLPSSKVKDRIHAKRNFIALV
jgi:hypothetical protein